jgi:hypothetical protein
LGITELIAQVQKRVFAAGFVKDVYFTNGEMRDVAQNSLLK